MALSVSHPVSTRDTNIIPRTLARGLIRDVIRKESYHIMFILKHEKVFFCIMNLQSRDQYHFKGYDKGVMISISATADKYNRNVLSVLYMQISFIQYQVYDKATYLTGMVTSVHPYETFSLIKNNILHQSKNYKNHIENSNF